MARQTNAAPVIIKRKKNVIAGGHHGGAWKVAYADFVTAMMAFFMLMWLLGATTEKQRKGIADYFNPTIAINRVSGGGEGAFGGDSVLADQTLAKNGIGSAADRPEETGPAAGMKGQDPSAQALLADMEARFLARTGESMTMERLMRHVVTRVTDEGLVIELFDLPDAQLFEGETAAPTEHLKLLAEVLSDVLTSTENALAVNGYVRSYPLVLLGNPVWPLSSDRAATLRRLMVEAGTAERRIQRTTGFADRKPAVADPTANRNNRIEIVLLRQNR